MKLHVKLFLATLILINFSSIHAQSKTILKDSLFSHALITSFKTYAKESDKAYKREDFETANQLFDTLIGNLKNTYLRNFKAKSIKGKLITFKPSKEKATVLLTAASWCLKTDEEISVINDLAALYKDYITFKILYWDTKKDAKKASKKFSNLVEVLYIDESENMFCFEIKHLKHTFGFPTTFFLDQDLKLINISRKITVNTTKDIAYSNMLLNYEKELAPLLNKDTYEKDYLVNKNP